MGDFRKLMREKMALLKLDDRFAARYVNEGFSGGEKKRLEMLQMAVLEPEFAILDETDSGLDIDALRIVAEGVNAQLSPDLGVLLITHYQRLLELHQAGRGPRPGPGPDHQDRRPRPRPAAGGGGLRAHPARAPATRRTSRTTCPRPTPKPRSPARRTEAARSRWPSSAPSTPSPSGPTSRTSSATSAAGGWPTSTAPRRALKPRVVLDAVDGYNTRYTANVHRGIYTIGEEATAAYEAARAHGGALPQRADRARDRLRAQRDRGHQPRGLLLGPAATSRQADTIVLTELEHHSNLVPWQLLAQEQDADLEFVPFDEQGRLNQASYEVLLRTRPKLVAFNHVSNGLGTINPVREMVAKAHEAGALVLVDGAQAVPHLPVDVQDLGADFYVFSGHKALGPTGLGRALGAPRAARGDAAVHGRRRDDPRGPPAPHRRSTTCPTSSRPARRTSRPPSASGAALDYLDGASAWTRVRAHERELTAYALEVLPREVPGIRIHGPLDRRRARRHRDLQPARTSTPTTWPRCSTARRSPSAPATTARSRSTSGSARRPPPAPASTSTATATTSTAWRPAWRTWQRSSATDATAPTVAPPRAS